MKIAIPKTKYLLLNRRRGGKKESGKWYSKPRPTRNKTKLKQLDLEFNSSELQSSGKMKMPDKCTGTVSGDKTEFISTDIGSSEEFLIINLSLTL